MTNTQSEAEALGALMVAIAGTDAAQILNRFDDYRRASGTGRTPVKRLPATMHIAAATVHLRMAVLASEGALAFTGLCSPQLACETLLETELERLHRADAGKAVA